MECRRTVLVQERERVEGLLPWADHIAVFFLQDVLYPIGATQNCRTQNIPLPDVVGVLLMLLRRGHTLEAMQDPPDACDVCDAKHPPTPHLGLLVE